ncbi:tyrosine-type recombinase/integrase [Pseudophaeobacter sp.]|uniref:tyrosine-type recombinase/integrase n=1 Tax=Pseudophaeobacter sp. TaxID=1971739 RepID=UPI003296E51E
MRQDPCQLIPDYGKSLSACGASSIKRGRLIYVRQKTVHSNGMEISIPIDPTLKRVLDTIPKTNASFLQTKSGLQRSEKGLGKDMRKWCNAAGLPDCSSHGLRKAIARRLAEAGATPHQIMAVTGHKTMAEVERYPRDADRAKLANSGIKKMAKKFGQKK